MGLDMHLRGEKYHWTSWENPKQDRKEDGFPVHTIEVDIGYWRKHPDLHGYIVLAFAEGEDKCQRIELSEQDIKNIISTIKRKNLPHTEGFFFGNSHNSDKQVKEDIAIFEKALKWLQDGQKPPVDIAEIEMESGGPFTMHEVKIHKTKTKSQNVSRSVYYKASW